ncbi:uncharacterized protein LOC134811295 [Bolinopsis microptera]|uniref:uncharacterized protein LOC134811295 n=1 Tax=Bolinopsis microptera TaxID=2820187 RepID=UPI00307A1F77
MSRITLLLRLRARLVERCVHHTSSTSLTSRLLHTTPAVFKVSGPQRKRFAEELQQQMKRDELLGSGKGKLDFDKVPMEEQDMRSRDEGTVEEEEQSQPLELSALVELDLSESDLSHSESEAQIHSESAVSSVEEHSDGVPVNIMGDLESLFSDVAPPEPVVPEQEGVVESLGSEVDYNIYYNTVEGDRQVMEEKALGLRDLDSGIPLDHVVQFVRDYKCFDTEVIQARKGMYVEHVIITSVHNTKHLKDASRSFFKMCRDDYDMAMNQHNEKDNTGHTWKAYDVGHTMLHFFLPVQRAKFNLESFWLGQDAEYEDAEQEEDRYTSDLLEGLFPDEDFTRLGKPFELIRDSRDVK